jgi:hypothetical protein
MLEFVKKNKWIELEQIIWFGDKLKFGLYLKKIKETEFKHSILGSARFDYNPGTVLS